MAAKIKLEGDRLAWFELAYHLRMTVEALKEQITVSEFLEWQEFLRIHRQRDDKLHFYLAQVAAEVRKSFVKHPNSVKLSQFLLKFATPEEERIGGKPTPAFKEYKASLSKGAWFASIGFLPGRKAPSPKQSPKQRAAANRKAKGPQPAPVRKVGRK